MSKKFNIPTWTKSAPKLPFDEAVWFETFKRYSSLYYVLGDLNYGDGSRFAKIESLWLQYSKPQQTLYYIACCEKPTIKKTLEPVLPGMQVHTLHNGRIHLIVLYGNPQEELARLLLHGQGVLESQIRSWCVNEWLMDEQPPSQELKDIIRLLAGHSDEHVVGKSSPWAFPEYYPQNQEKKIAIVGGGFAGCFLARRLAEAQYQVTIFEAGTALAQVGSGNQHALLYPKFSAYQAPFTELLHLCYPYALRVYQDWIGQIPSLGKMVEIWQSKDEFHAELMPYLSLSPSWFLDLEEGYLMRKSMLMDMPLFCEYLVDHPLIQVKFVSPIEELCRNEKGWLLQSQTFPHVVLANGHLVNRFSQSKHLGIKGMRGQMTHVREIYRDNIVYCQEGHFCASWKGVHGVGASFDPTSLELDHRLSDDEKNIAPWRDFFAEPLKACGHWTGIRGVSLDHMPCVGPLPELEAFQQRFGKWRHHANLKMDDKMPNQPGLWVFTGFGARGLLTIPYLAEILKQLIVQQPVMMATDLLQSISPARFYKKKLIRNEE